MIPYRILGMTAHGEIVLALPAGFDGHVSFDPSTEEGPATISVTCAVAKGEETAEDEVRGTVQ